MLDSRRLWLVQNIAVGAFHVVAIALIAFGGLELSHPISLLWLAILGLHVLEIPVARSMLRDHEVPKHTLVIKTLIFGFTWWLPRSRGVYAS